MLRKTGLDQASSTVTCCYSVSITPLLILEKTCKQQAYRKAYWPGPSVVYVPVRVYSLTLSGSRCWPPRTTSTERDTVSVPEWPLHGHCALGLQRELWLGQNISQIYWFIVLYQTQYLWVLKWQNEINIKTSALVVTQTPALQNELRTSTASNAEWHRVPNMARNSSLAFWWPLPPASHLSQSILSRVSFCPLPGWNWIYRWYMLSGSRKRTSCLFIVLFCILDECFGAAQNTGFSSLT